MAKYTSKLLNKRILVVGGTSGIGFCVAEAAIEHGAVVVIASSSQSNIDATIQRIRKDYPGAHITGQACNLADPKTADDNVKTLLEFATEDGKLDHIVNTAAASVDIGALDSMTPERFFVIQQIRLVGSLLLGKHSKNYMNQTNTSSLIFTGGVNSYKPNPGWSIAAGAGAGIEGLVRGLAVDLKPVRVNMVAPGAVFTELWTKNFPDAEGARKVWASKCLTGEVGSPEDTAEAYIYFMKDKFVTGTYILTDGGYVLN